jgi:integrase
MAGSTRRPGTLRERPPGNGHWQLRVFVGFDGASGRRHQIARTFIGTKREATLELAKMVTEVNGGHLDRDHSGITVVTPARERAKGRRLADKDRWPFRFHDLRHFSVTTLIAAGVDIRTVAERHGHAQATMTLNRYAHALPERDRHAATVLGDTFTSTRTSRTSARPELGAGGKNG